MKNNKWRAFQITQLVFFLGLGVFIFLRKVDGSGAENTAEVKLISLAIWIGFYLFVLAVEYVVRLLTRKGKHK